MKTVSKIFKIVFKILAIIVGIFLSQHRSSFVNAAFCV